VTVNSVLPGPTRSEGIVDFLKSLASDPQAPSEQIEREFFAHASSVERDARCGRKDSKCA
jgi:hypothetical protein